jgi:hypothetical protein
MQITFGGKQRTTELRTIKRCQGSANHGPQY